MKKIRIGVIGVGNISNMHIQSYRNNPNVEIYAFCDINKEQLEMMGKKYGVERLFTNRDEMLALKEIDAVSVCTWNVAHAECTIAALNAGKNVLCEKPMAMNTEQALAMKVAAEKNHKLLMIGFVRRFGQDFRIMQEFLAKDYFGEVYYTKAAYLRANGSPGGWFSNSKLSGGGPLIDLGVHVIDFDRCMMGKPKAMSVFGTTSHRIGQRDFLKDPKAYNPADLKMEQVYDVEDFASAMIRFDNGSVMEVETSYDMYREKDIGTLEVYGTKAGAKIDPDIQLFSTENGYLVDKTFKMGTAIDFDNIFQNEINHYVDCLVNGVPTISPAEDGVEIMRILDAIYKSAETKHEVVIA